MGMCVHLASLPCPMMPLMMMMRMKEANSIKGMGYLKFTRTLTEIGNSPCFPGKIQSTELHSVCYFQGFSLTSDLVAIRRFVEEATESAKEIINSDVKDYRGRHRGEQRQATELNQ